MNKLRWGKFYWSDWSDDPALASCSLAAQGLWMRLLCIAAQGTPYGAVTVAGKPPSMATLQKLIRPKPKLETLVRLIDELKRNGVCQEESDRTLVSRRMESDGKIASVRSKAANKRWNNPDLHMQTPPPNGNGAMHESQKPESKPPKPPARSGGRGKDGGWTQVGNREVH